MINPAATFGAVQGQTAQALFKLNAKLADNGLPFYWYGGAEFNTAYRMYPTPRYLFQWRPPFLKVEQIYLSYMAESPAQVDVVFTDSTNSISLTPSNPTP